MIKNEIARNLPLDELRRHRDRVPKSEYALLAAISPGGSPPRGTDLAYTAADLLSAWR